MAKVLVTGAGGYVGRHTVTALADIGHEVTGTTRPGSRQDVDPRARVCEVDILGQDIVAEQTFGFVPDVIVHLAWADGFRHNARSHIENLSAHFNFLTAMVDQGVAHIAALGTMHEVGYWEGAIDASTPTTPLSLYGVSKNALRRGLEIDLAGKAVFQWLRCYYIYGDDRNNQSIFTRLLCAVDEGKSTFPFTTGTSKYDFILVEELGRQIAAVASQTAATGIINCCTGNPVSLATQVEAFIKNHELPLSLEYGAFPDRPYDSPAVWGDATVINGIMADARTAL